MLFLKVSLTCRKCGQDKIIGALNWHLGTANIPSPIISHNSSPSQKHLFCGYFSKSTLNTSFRGINLYPGISFLDFIFLSNTRGNERQSWSLKNHRVSSFWIYNEFITCFHEFWIYEKWFFFPMTFVVCFDLFKMDFHLRIKIDYKMQT